MRKIFLLFVLASVFAMIPVLSYAAQDNAFVLDRNFCKYVIAHNATKDVSAEYKSGVDVNGNPVVEADLAKNNMEPLDSISFPLTVDMAKYIGMQIPEGVKTGEASLGYVEVREDGEILFNGNPLQGEAEVTLKNLCAAYEKTKQSQEVQKIEENSLSK